MERPLCFSDQSPSRLAVGDTDCSIAFRLPARQVDPWYGLNYSPVHWSRIGGRNLQASRCPGLVNSSYPLNRIMRFTKLPARPNESNVAPHRLVCEDGG